MTDQEIINHWATLLNALDLALKGEFPKGRVPMEELVMATGAVASRLESTLEKPLEPRN
jgi:hypothetical protein